MAGEAVRANYKVTFHRMKTGFTKAGSAKYAGKVVVAGIGIPGKADII